MIFTYLLTLPLLFVLWIYLILIIRNNLIANTSIQVNIIDHPKSILENVTATQKRIRYHVPKFMLELYEKNKSVRKNEAEADLVRSLIPMQAEEDHLLIFEIPNSAKDEQFIGAELKILTQIEANQTLKLSIFDDLSNSYSFHSEIIINQFNDTWISFNLTQQVSKIFRLNLEKRILKMIITLYHQDNNVKLSLMPEQFDHNHNYPILLLSYAIRQLNVSIRHKRSIFEEDYEEETNNIWKNVKKLKKAINYCRRRPLHINFSEINYDLWIVQPSSYEAYQCQGRCFYPVAEHLSPTKHAIMQALIHSVNPLKASRSCCVPTVLDSISILYVDERGVLTYRASLFQNYCKRPPKFIMGKSISIETQISNSESTARKGKITRNPFLNFLSQFRTTKKGLRAPKIAQLGGEAWRSMSEEEKAPFILMAKQTKKSRRKKTGWNKKKRQKLKSSNKNKSEANMDDPFAQEPAEESKEINIAEFPVDSVSIGI